MNIFVNLCFGVRVCSIKTVSGRVSSVCECVKVPVCVSVCVHTWEWECPMYFFSGGGPPCAPEVDALG